MDPNLEQQLVADAKRSLEAFDKLYEYYLPKILAYVMNRTANKAIAEDITSQTFVKAMLKIKTFEYKGFTFGAWLYRIAHNTLVDYYRKHKEIEIPEYHQAQSDDNSELVAQQSERQQILLDALRKLPEQYQQILSLKFFEEMTNEEIAQVLGCKKETLAVKLHRSLKAFEKVLKKNKTLETLGLY